jgi:hypothetical protein
MTLRPCRREKELLTTLRTGQWPQVCDPDLRAHIDSCSLCRDTVMLKAAFQSTLAATRSAAPLDSPNLLWWRAQLRRRNAAMERLSRPVAGAHRFALVINILAALGLALELALHRDLWRPWLTELFHPAALPSLTEVGQSALFHPAALPSLTDLVQNWSLALLIPAAAAIAILSGVAIYLAAERP